MKPLINLLFIGCGKFATKRLSSIPMYSYGHVYVYDVNPDQAWNFCSGLYENKYTVLDGLENLRSKQINLAFVCTPPNSACEYARHLLESGIDVVIEKPGAINSQDLVKLYEIQKVTKRLCYIAYNHRFHSAVERVAKDLEDNLVSIGNILSINGYYGHGGRENYDKEWRFNKALSGYGELSDKGCHLIDLAFMAIESSGEEVEVSSVTGNTYSLVWKNPDNMPDNAVINFVLSKKIPVHLVASSTEWKNTFWFEIVGRYGKLRVEGLSGSYGREKSIWYDLKKDGCPPIIYTVEHEPLDNSLEKEYNWIIDNLSEFGSDYAYTNLPDAIEVMKIVEEVGKEENFIDIL